MKKNLFLLAIVFLGAGKLHAQQWSNEPAIDSLKKHQAAEIKAREELAWCQEGINSQTPASKDVYATAIPWKFVDFNKAVSSAEKKLDVSSLQRIQIDLNMPPLTAGELALKLEAVKKIEQEITNTCNARVLTEECKYAQDTPHNLALARVVENSRQEQLLQKMEKEIAAFCATHPTGKCKTETTHELALFMLPKVLAEQAAKANVDNDVN